MRRKLCFQGRTLEGFKVQTLQVKWKKWSPNFEALKSSSDQGYQEARSHPHFEEQ